MSLATIRTAIKNAITIDGLTVYDYVPANPDPPCAVVSWPDEFDPHAAFGDNADYTIPVVLMVAAQTDEADAQLMAYLDTSGTASVVAEIEAGSHAWMVGSVHDFAVIPIGMDTREDRPRPMALSCIVDVHVMA